MKNNRDNIKIIILVQQVQYLHNKVQERMIRITQGKKSIKNNLRTFLRIKEIACQAEREEPMKGPRK